MNHALTSVQLQNALQGFEPVAKKSHSLHKDCYVEPSYYEVEQQQILAKSWQLVCHEEKLRELGSYVTTEVQGHSILVIRTQNGQLNAFYNVCKHRAHQLLSGAGTTAVITCPYHAWVYQLDGTLLNARRSELIDNFDKSSICLTKVKLETFCHFIFVNLDEEAASLTEMSGDLEQEIISYAPDIANLTFAKRLTYNIKSNWKSVVDNFLECYHCPVAHKDFCSLIDIETYKITTHDYYSSHMAKAVSNEGVDANNAYSIKNARVTDHAVWFLWPNTALMRYPGASNFMVWRFYPLSENETLEIFDFFFESDTPSETEMEAIKFIDEVLQPEDIALVESVQKGMQTPAYEQGRYMIDDAGSGMSEHALHHFHGLVLEAYKSAAV